MKKLIFSLLLLTALSCSEEPELKKAPVKLKTAMQPPPGCGTDSNGVKYCCNQYGNCWKENW
jgi:hypothetical protein